MQIYLENSEKFHERATEERLMKARGLTKETILEYGMPERNFPSFNIGDSLEVSLRVKEGEKERVQLFAGDVIAQHNNGIASTFTIRKIAANSIGVEKILPYYSPIIADIKVLKRGKVRRAKLFYVRDLLGKAARIQERVLTKEQKASLKEEEASK
jgi:large subunit ribosomal protein L19